MARRDRVPRHKSHNQKKNKNPKLSPFQREQKRAKLANQAPGAHDDDLDAIPHSQRRVYQYLMEKKARDAARREQSQLASDQAANDADGEEELNKSTTSTSGAVTSLSKKRRLEKAQALEEESDDESTDAAASSSSPLASSTTSAVAPGPSKKKRNKNPFGAASLNAELIEEVAPARRLAARVPEAVDDSGEHVLTLEERIAKKKEKKHARKAELRRQRVTEKLQNMEAELSKLVRGKKKKKGVEDENIAFERKLRQMQAERAREQKAAKAQADSAAAAAATSAAKTRKRARSSQGDDGDEDGGHDRTGSEAKRKHISFDSTVEEQVARDADGTELPHAAMRFPKDNRGRRGDGFARPTDFYDLVDVVRFGERVEAPPVFDVVPNHNAAITRLAGKLEAEAAAATGTHRHRLLSGGGGLGEQKRLARMGLAPAITGTVVAASGSGRRATAAADKEAAKAKEMLQLRDHVMAAYQNNKRRDVESRKGVNMKHEFPRFS